MSRFGKADNAGRSSGKHNGRRAKFLRPPKDKSWTWYTRELMCSDAWRLQSKRCRMFVDFLAVDHMANAGQENGHLKATYDQLALWGLSRSSVSKAIDEAKVLGLVCCTKQGGRFGGTNRPSEYRLTFYAYLNSDDSYSPPTNDFKKVSQQDIERWRELEQFKTEAKKNIKEKQKAGPKSRSSLGRKDGLASSKLQVVK